MSTYREACFEAMDERCNACGATDSLDVHHIDGNGSNNEVSNLIPLCESCHAVVERHCWTSVVDAPIDSNNPLIQWLVKVKRSRSPNTEVSERAEVSVPMPAELLDQIEEQLEYGDSRVEWIREAIRQRLEREAGNQNAGDSSD